MSALEVSQPAVPAERVAAASGALLRYRIMAFVTGVKALTPSFTSLVERVSVVCRAVDGSPESTLGWYFASWLTP